MADKVKNVKSYEAKCPNGGHINKYEICINCKQKETLTLVKSDIGSPTGFKCSNGHVFNSVECETCKTVIYWKFFTVDGEPLVKPKPKPKPYKWVEELFFLMVVVVFLVFFLGICS